MSYVLGVDLGTTFSAAAAADATRVEILQLGLHQAAIPSVVAAREDGALAVGEAAQRPGLPPENVAREFKRRLGDPTPLLLGGVPYGAETLTERLLAAILRHVREERGSEPDLVVLTHPAGYGPYKTSFLDEAAHRAGLAQPRLLPEPTAAAIAYAAESRVDAGDLLLVYDFGGGTLDVAAIRTEASGFEIVGTPQGMERFGGSDLDEAVLAHVMAEIGQGAEELDQADPAVASAVAALRVACRDAKEALSFDPNTVIPVMLPAHHGEVRLTRGEFEAMLRPRLVDTVGLLERAVRSADADMSDVRKILLVGGASRIPLVAAIVREATGRPIALDANPKHAVALGAASYGAQLSADLWARNAGVAPVASSAEPVAAPSARVVPPQASASVDPASADGSGDGTTPPPPHPPDDEASAATRRRRRTVVAVTVSSLAVLMAAVAWLVATLGSETGQSTAEPGPVDAGNTTSAVIYQVSYGSPGIDEGWGAWADAPGATPPDDIASDYYPHDGLTSSSDPAVVETHLTMARDLGVDVIAVEWHVVEPAELPRVEQVVALTGDIGLQALMWIDLPPGDDPQRAIDALDQLGDLADHPSLYRSDRATPSLPAGPKRAAVVLDGVDATPAEAWRDVTEAIHARGLVVLAATSDGLFVEAGGFDGLAAGPLGSDVNYAWMNGVPEEAWVAPVVLPGRSGDRIGQSDSNLDRSAGETLSRQWELATTSQRRPALVIVDSLNDWRRGTQIAPARAELDGLPRDYRTYEPLPPEGYLDLTQSLVTQGRA